jgi:predicted ATPase/class 3 adenylate cyclase
VTSIRPVPDDTVPDDTVPDDTVPDDTVSDDAGGDSTTRTLLFTDMEGSTARWESEPDAARTIERHFEVLRAAVGARGGVVFATMGDGVAAAFDSAAAGAQAATDAQRHFVREGLQVRMSLHTGEVLRVGDDFRGRPLNRAARIAAIAHGGQILVSSVTAHLLRTGPDPVELVDLGCHRLRDLTEPERIWQIRDSGLAPQLPPLRSLDAVPNNLPVRRSEFVGRDDELSKIAESLEHHRVVTLMGPGGVGKTRLALQAAAELWNDTAATWFVSLADVDASDDVLRAVAIAMRVDPMGGALPAIRAALDARPALLVLDNCEHVVDRAADAVEQLTESVRSLRILVTTREAMSIEGEFVIPVRPLDPRSEALELFELRANAVGAPMNGEQRELAVRICERLDGLPLAIELAAARVPTLGLPAIVEGLDDRFWLLSGGRQRGGDRHQTMRATVGWSYQLLDEAERRLLEWLAMFPGGFELDAVRHVASVHGLEPSMAPDLVGSLVRKSMVEADIGAPIVRYRLLETVRAFALDALHEHGQARDAAITQAEWVAQLTDLPIDQPCSAAVERHAIRLEREAENWRKAVLTARRFSSSDLARRLCGPPTSLFLLGRVDLHDVLVPLLDVCADPSARHAVVRAVAVVCAGGADPGQVRKWSDELNQLEGDQPTGAAQLVEWMALCWEGRIADAIDLCLRAADDRRLAQDTRDLFLGLAMTECFGRPPCALDADVLAARALEAAGRTDVGGQRVTCLLGAAWALHGHEPNRAMSLTHEVFRALPDLPASLQRTLPGNAARLMTRMDTASAACHLLERLDAVQHPSSYVDLIPAFYATELLHRLGNPLAGPALATLAASPIASFLALKNFDGIACDAAARFAPIAVPDLIRQLREELSVLADADEQAAHASSRAEAPPISPHSQRPGSTP